MRAVALGLSTALLTLAVAEIKPAQASEVFAFQCLKAGDQAVIALGHMPKPVGGVAMNPETLGPQIGIRKVDPLFVFFKTYHGCIIFKILASKY